MENQTLISRIQGGLAGVSIGDALGMPVETLSAEQIEQLTGGLGITGFQLPPRPRPWDPPNLTPGQTTDDWQLTKAVATSLIRSNGFSENDCAAEHVRAYEASTFGWGTTTREAIGRTRSGQRDAARPLPEAKGSCGNGVIMKVAPLALYAPLSGTPDLLRLVEDCLSLGRITHRDVRASEAALAVALCLALCLQSPLLNTEGSDELLDAIAWHIRRVEASFAELHLEAGKSTERVSGRLDVLAGGCLGSAAELRKAVGCGFYALETVAFTLGTFFRHPTDFRAGVLEAVNAGGDTDTNAAIVGALIGTNCGLEAIPAEWRTTEAYREAVELGQQLAELHLQKNER